MHEFGNNGLLDSSSFSAKDPIEKKLLESLRYNLTEYDFEELQTADGTDLIFILLAKEFAPKVEYLLQPISFTDYRKRWIQTIFESFTRNIKLERNGNHRGKFLENSLDEVNLNGWLYSSFGIVTDQETEECLKFLATNQIFDLVNKKMDANIIKALIKELATPLQTQVIPDDKHFKLRTAKEQIRRLKVDGFRTGIAFGGFDLKHKGHEHFLKKAKKLLGKYGQLFVAVDPDFVLTANKGSKRPIVPQKDRIEALSNLAFVDSVIALPTPKYIEGFDLESYYQKAQTELSPNFRILGEVDDKFNLYAKQCKNAGIGLVYTDYQNETSTTELINKILNTYGN